MLTEKHRQYGPLKTVIYDFEVPGDTLALHVHSEQDVHISIIGRGSFRCFGHGWEKTLECGDVVDWQPGTWHGFEALTARSRLVNVVKS